VSLQVSIDAGELQRLNQRLLVLTDRNMRYVVARAMTSSARAAQQELKRETPRYLASPVTWTVNSTYVRYAKPNNLAVEVGFKDFASGGTPAGRYLNPLVEGGFRNAKPHENLLWNSGAVPRGRYLVPTGVSPLRLNSAGNIPASRYVQVLSRLKSLREVGSTQNVTGSARSQGKRSDRDFFVGRPGGLPLGIYARMGRRPKGRAGGRPATIMLPRGFHTVFYLTGRPNYRAQFPIPSILNSAFERSFTRELQAGLSAELQLGRGLR
jgi:hypothetical protein